MKFEKKVQNARRNFGKKKINIKINFTYLKIHIMPTFEDAEKLVRERIT
jgi:hypothetical protein